ncbi:MAG: 3-oxoadipate enol-lactonase [Lewinella sp.]
MKTYYQLEGTPNSPVLLLSNSLGADLSMWDQVVPFLLPYFQVLRYDTRGLGKSEVTDHPYAIEQLGHDVIDLLDKLGFGKVYFCGLSMGGQVGQWIGVHHANRLHKLVLCNTAAHIGTAEGWNQRIEQIKAKGLSSIWDNTQKIWLRESFIRENPILVEQWEQMFTRNDILGYANCCAAVRDADFRADLEKIKTETLVLTGNEDPATTVADAEFLQQHIPNAQITVLPARHLPSLEQPALLAETLINFLVGNSTFERGMHVRRTVLGDAHVERASESINDFNGDFQSFISHYAWGEIWTRPGLPKHHRSLITLAMMIALNRGNEFKMHVRAALNNGVTITEIKEVILQSGVYCGLPAANEAYHLAQAVFKEEKVKF